MADIRIKDLTTTASSTASDDFIAVDGATNGTRKLNAYSPSFGGNATVQGTLAVSGGSVTLTGAAYSIFYADGSSGGNFTIRKAGVAYGTLYGNETNTVLDSAGSANLILQTGGATRGTFTSSGLTVNATTASTSTSTGALVVSGGVGVAGAANIGGTLTVSGTGASSFGGRLAIGATALSDRMFYVSGNTGTTGASQFSAVVNPTIPNTVTTGAYGLYLGTNIATGATVTNGYSLFIAAPDYTGSTVANKYGLYSNDPNPSYFVGNVLVGSTTASTSTSTGALVVSGGVGVAGAIYLGGLLVSSGSNGGLATESRDGSGYRTTWYNPTGDDMQLDFAGIGTKFTITSAGDTTIAGKITTSAPTGGAGAWELGTYSSTAPSATGYVTIEIGGTVYKLLASNV